MLSNMFGIRFPPEWGVNPVPRDKRELRGIDFFVLWSSLGVGLLVFQAGMLLVPALSLLKAIAISAVGSAVGSLLLATVGLVGSEYGVPTMVSLRPLLGRYGSYLPTVLNVVQLVGWTAFELMVMADSAVLLSGMFLGGLTRPFWLIVFTVIVTLFAVGGPLAVVRQWLEKFAIWLVYASTVWITYQVARDLSIFSTAGTGGLSIPLALDLVIAMPVSWMPLVSDYNRFARSGRRCFAGTLLGYSIANTWFYGLGAALAVATGKYLAPSSILSIYVGAVALIAILVDETDNAFADVYSTAVSLQNLWPGVKQWKLVLAASGLGAILAYTVPLAEYEHFLLIIGASFVPLFGVFISEYFIVRGLKLQVEEFYRDAPALRSESIISWALGFAVYLFFAYRLPSIGATLPALLFSALAQLVISKLRR